MQGKIGRRVTDGVLIVFGVVSGIPGKGAASYITVDIFYFVGTFIPTPMAMATTMYHSERNPLRKVNRSSEHVGAVRNGRQRKLQKAFLRYHDPANWPLLREALKEMGRADLIGNGKKQLIPAWQPAGTGGASAPTRTPVRRSTPPLRGAPVRRTRPSGK
jgi:hypothetical protein